MSRSNLRPIKGRITLYAPIDGVMVPMETVPDPVFAQKMVGEGVCVDPLDGRLHAPVDGEVVQLHPSAHALTVRTREGMEILLHIGLDTVHLRGQGFTTHVRVGDQVRSGDLLITFDLDHLATHAKSLLTQVVVATSGRTGRLTPRTGRVAVGDPVAQVELTGAEEGDDGTDLPGYDGGDPTGNRLPEPSTRRITSPAVLVTNAAGLHARPAATLVRQARQFRSEVWLVHDDVQANAKSIIAIMGLDVGHGAKVRVVASGPDAEQTAQVLSAAIAAGLGGEDLGDPGGAEPDAGGEPPRQGDDGTEPAGDRAGDRAPGSSRDRDPGRDRGRDRGRELRGAAVSPGLAVGTVVQLRPEDIEVAEQAGDRHAERRRLNDAIDRAQTQLWALENRLRLELDVDKAAIFGAHREILNDPDLLDLAASAIDKGKSAAFAWRATYTVFADRIAGLRSQVLAARAADVRDVGQRVLEELIGRRGERGPMPPHSILVAEDLSPSDTVELDRSLVVGFVTTRGGASSHVAILARSLDIPAIAGIDARALDIPDSTRVVIDGGTGILHFDVADVEVERIWRRQTRRTERRAVELAHADEPAITRDGHRIEVTANISGVDDAGTASLRGAEGIGLLRSEFLFLGRRTVPDEDEQTRAYRRVAEALRPGQPLVIRTLDVGGDKPLPSLHIPPEENPFLGERGIRVSLAHPEVLRTQLRAVLRTAAACAGDGSGDGSGDGVGTGAADGAGRGVRVQVMFPMVATLGEYRAARAVLEEERQRLGVPPVPVGVMVEVPSVAVTAARFAAEVDFFSIGTNDLTQYTLAMDRGHPRLAPQVDGVHPAVLALIEQTVIAAEAAGLRAAVCGGTAADPQAVPLLLGLGVRELSVPVPAVPAVKARIRTLSLDECRSLVECALIEDSAAAVRALVPAVDEEELP
ncbi:MAG: HPr family phosphocarrier protein [Actinomycetales bacterium]|nr:HPr family phosphocarrier protein [Actinomycetales bacterium]